MSAETCTVCGFPQFVDGQPHLCIGPDEQVERTYLLYENERDAEQVVHAKLVTLKQSSYARRSLEAIKQYEITEQHELHDPTTDVLSAKLILYRRREFWQRGRTVRVAYIRE